MHAPSITILLLASLAAPLAAQTQGLTYERWNNLPGNSVETLRHDGINARLPDHVGTVTLASAPVDVGNNHGTRLRGQLVAPATGDYTFFIAGDDNVELWLAHDPAEDPAFDTTAPWNRRLIAWHRHYTASNQWDKSPSQRSEAIHLQAGESYHLEALAKGDTGGDHLSIGWHREEGGSLALTTWTPHSFTFTPQSDGTTGFSVASGDIWGSNDNGAFHHQPWTGDGVFTIEVGGLNNPQEWAKTGLMIREFTTDNSRHAFLVRRTGTNGVVFQHRLATGGASTHAASSTNNWNHLRLERSGDTITARISADGDTWSYLDSTTLTGLAATIHVGFAASSNIAASLTGWHGPLDARENIASDPVPAPTANFGIHNWYPNPATWSPQADGTIDFSVISGDIFNTIDRGSFHARTWTGDGEFITRLGGFNGSDPWAKAGLMIRADGWEASRHASLFQTYGHGISFYHRATDIGGTIRTYIPIANAATHPWLRLVRTGNTVTASSSPDGRLWEYRGSATFTNLPDTITVGHAICANNNYFPTTGWFGPITARPLTATEIIPGDHLIPHSPHPDDPSDAGLPESWMLAHNLDPQDPFGNNGPHGDPDNDGLDNLTEYQSGTDPHTTAPLAGALTRELWTLVPGKTIADLVAHSRFYGTPNEVSLIPNIDFGVTDWNLPFGMRYRGELVAPVTGAYRFWIAGNENAELWLADGTIIPRGESNPRTDRFGKRRIAWVEDERSDLQLTSIADFDANPSQRSAIIHLQAGQPYHIEALLKACGEAVTNRDHLAIAWQPPGQPREIIPAEHFRSHMPSPDDLEDDGVPNDWQANNGLDDPAFTPFQRGQYGDPDDDKLTNLQEYQFGTNPLSSDTDGDGLTDYDEIFLYGTDPLVSNLLAPVVAATPAPHQYAAATGGWNANSDGTLSAWDRRGEITYSFTTTQPGIHEIILTGSAIGDIRPVERLPITLTLNATTIADSQLVSEDGAPDTLRAITPLLAPGTHTLTILHDNYRADRRLRIHSIEILRLGGDDLNQNDIPDWAEQNAQSANSLTRVLAHSRTSPLSIEGITQNLATATLTHTPNGASEALPLSLTRSINDTFFTDVPLSEDGSIALDASFLNGLVETSHTIEWIPTNLFDFHDGELHIRKDDSLLITAHQGATPTGTFSLTSEVYWSSKIFTVNGGFGQNLDTGMIDQDGTLFLAENSGGAAETFDGISFGAGTITFGNINPPGVHALGYHEGTPTGNTNLAKFGTFSGVEGPGTVSLSGLTPGQQYRVQLLFFDGILDGENSARTVSVDGIDQGRYTYGIPYVSWGAGRIVSGIFTADDETKDFTIEIFEEATSTSLGAQLNAIVVHEIEWPASLFKTGTAAEPVPVLFHTPGTHTIVATWTPDEGPEQTANVTVHVHEADFGPAHSVRAYSPRSWTPPLLGQNHLIEADDRLTLAETTPFPLPLGEGQGEGAQHVPRTFHAAVHHAGNRHAIARLPHDVDGAPSAILARGTVHGFHLAYLDETTDPRVIHRYDDGTWLMSGSMVAVNLPADILIRLTTMMQGTVFHNGDNTLWLDSSNFNPNGITTIYYEWAGSGQPHLCNHLHLFIQPD